MDDLNTSIIPSVPRQQSKSRLGKLSFYFDEINKPIDEDEKIDKLDTKAQFIVDSEDNTRQDFIDQEVTKMLLGDKNALYVIRRVNQLLNQQEAN
mgnify:CR=1 FL=1|jgi:hypothetical protein